jgi:hypothetical protein
LERYLQRSSKMQFVAAVLALFTWSGNEVAENFTGRVLEGSNDRLLRVERRPAVAGAKRAAHAVMVLQDCGPLPPGSTYEFSIWAGSFEEVRPCLAVNGKPPVSVTRGMPAEFGVLYGRVKVEDASGAKRIGQASVEVRCGDRVWSGKVDRGGRFWTMAPPGQCRVIGALDGFAPVEELGSAAEVPSGGVAFTLVELKPWRIWDKVESLFRTFLSQP